MPWPPPVTTATRPSNLNLSRYTGTPPSVGLLGRVKRIGQRMTLQTRQRPAVGIGEVAGLRIDADGDTVMHAGWIVAIGLHDEERSFRRPDVQVGLAAEPLRDDDVAGEFAPFAGLQVFRSHAERELGARL